MSELDDFASRYAKAWCSQNPEKVAAFFAENGSISINNGPPAVGRAAIAEIARGFMRDFPDMIVKFDRLDSRGDAIAFHWTLTGTNTRAGGTGNVFESAVTNSGRSATTDSSRNRKGISTPPSTNASSKASDE
jgi:uncharacterized protein (TIGR02246 family)